MYIQMYTNTYTYPYTFPLYIYICIYIIYIYISADPGLRQGRGGAWDHRRCGSCLSNPCHAQRRRQKPPQGHSNGSKAPHSRSNGFFYRRSRLPFARPQTLQTLQILQKSAQLRRQKVPQQAQRAPRPQAKATTRPQQWLKGTPRPQQWLLIGV